MPIKSFAFMLLLTLTLSVLALLFTWYVYYVINHVNDEYISYQILTKN